MGSQDFEFELCQRFLANRTVLHQTEWVLKIWYPRRFFKKISFSFDSSFGKSVDSSEIRILLSAFNIFLILQSSSGGKVW